MREFQQVFRLRGFRRCVHVHYSQRTGTVGKRLHGRRRRALKFHAIDAVEGGYVVVASRHTNTRAHVHRHRRPRIRAASEIERRSRSDGVGYAMKNETKGASDCLADFLFSAVCFVGGFFLLFARFPGQSAMENDGPSRMTCINLHIHGMPKGRT